jgi:2-dehydropantoate 2-reductase
MADQEGVSMKILVMGAGALGCYFGARLQAAGHDVTFVARGPHLDAMRAQGLRIESPLGDVVLDEVRATDDPCEAGSPDVVLFMVKNYDVGAAARSLAPALAPDTLVVTCQNGVSAPARLAEVIGPDRVHPGAVYMPADVKAPGVVRHSGQFHKLVFGPLQGRPGARAQAFAEAVRASGPDCVIVEDIRAALWEKFVLLASLSALTTVTRLDIGPVRDCAETRDLLARAVAEAVAVGQADCPALPDDAGDKALAMMLGMGPNVHASMLDDLVRGRRIEVEHLSGEIVRLGRVHGIPTPVHDVLSAVLMPFAEGPPRHG